MHTHTHTHTHTHPLPLFRLRGVRQWDIMIFGLLKAALCVICEADQSDQLTFQYSVSSAREQEAELPSSPFLSLLAFSLSPSLTHLKAHIYCNKPMQPALQSYI